MPLTIEPLHPLYAARISGVDLRSVSDAQLPTGLTEALLAPTVDAPSTELVSVTTVKRAVKSVVR